MIIIFNRYSIHLKYTPGSQEIPYAEKKMRKKGYYFRGRNRHWRSHL